MKIWKPICLLIFGILVSGCSVFSSPQPFEGTWNSLAVPPNYSYLTYTFDSGTYEISGYPPLSEVGTYQVVSVEGATYTLQLTPTSAESPNPQPYQVTVEIQGQNILINQMLFSTSI